MYLLEARTAPKSVHVLRVRLASFGHLMVSKFHKGIHRKTIQYTLCSEGQAIAKGKKIKSILKCSARHLTFLC